MSDIDAAAEAVRSGAMSQRAASKKYDVPRTTLRRHLARAEVPDGFMVKGTSTLVDPNGAVKLQWIKMSADMERQKAMLMETVEAMKESMPRMKPVSAPKKALDELVNTYVITDFHYGMLAHYREGGANWDLKIAEKTLLGCFSHMMAGAPNAKVGIIAQLGDFLHQDSIAPMTGTVGTTHTVDADGRFSKIVRSAIKSLRAIVDMALAKHERVHVLMAEGNHDLSSSIWLRSLFAALYENEPRVTIDDSDLPFYAYQHGNTMLAFHHGHLKKFAALTNLFAAEFAQMWGATTHRYGHCGHLHHKESKEDMGMTITQHRTLAARDSFSSRHGYHSNRGAQCVTYHSKYGEAGTNNVTPEMIQ